MLTIVRYREFERPTFELKIHESVNSDLLSEKRGSHEDCCGCRFSDREIEEP
jgi:hypothetical protein